MGGFGSGRYPRFRGRKERADDCCALDIRLWAREGLLVEGHSFSRAWKRDGAVILRCEFLPTEAGLRVIRPREFLSFAWTPCQYGGRRVWLRCPDCDSRRAKLHSTAAGFRCRGCAGLAYRTQHENRGNRLVLKAKRIGARIGGGGVMPGTFLGKPPRMHWRTFERLEARALEAWAAGLQEWERELSGVLAALSRR